MTDTSGEYSRAAVYMTQLSHICASSNITSSSLQNQRSSSLLNLRAEFRNTIYAAVLGNWEIRFGKGQHSSIIVRSTSDKASHAWARPKNLLALTATSRRLWVDTRFLIFELNEFRGCTDHMVDAWSGRLLKKRQLERIERVRMMLVGGDWDYTKGKPKKSLALWYRNSGYSVG
jgi:hypothetical protein